MAKYCWDCIDELKLGAPDFNDFRKVAGRGKTIQIYCDGCGEIVVDFKGKKFCE